MELFDEPSDVDHGYNPAFRFLGAVSVFPAIIFVPLVGETAPHLAPRGAPTPAAADDVDDHMRNGQAGWGALLCDRVMFGGTLRAMRQQKNTAGGR